jgi:hypothetical protein
LLEYEKSWKKYYDWITWKHVAIGGTAIAAIGFFWLVGGFSALSAAFYSVGKMVSPFLT